MASTEKINIPFYNAKELNADSVAKTLEQYFVGDHKDLLETLSLFAFENLTEFFNEIGTFFNEQFDFDNLTREHIENLDYKALAYNFANKLKIERPLVTNTFIKEKVILIFGKLARLFIHEILFPELIKIDPRLAVSVRNQIKRAAGSIAIIEGIEKRFAYDIIKIDDVNIDLQVTFLPPLTKITTDKETTKKKITVFFKTCLKEASIDKLGKTLKTEYGIIYSITEFRGLIFSDGQWNGSLRVKNEKQKWFIWLIDQMYNERRLIQLNKTKGYWKLLQGIVIDENEKWFPRQFTKVCNEIRKLDTEEHRLIKNDIETILTPFKTN